MKNYKKLPFILALLLLCNTQIAAIDSVPAAYNSENLSSERDEVMARVVIITGSVMIGVLILRLLMKGAYEWYGRRSINKLAAPVEIANGLEYFGELPTQISDFMRWVDKTENWEYLPLGYILDGHPGVGKTHLVRYVAQEKDALYFYLSQTKIRSFFYGLSAKQLCDFLDHVKYALMNSQKNIAVLLLDEADTLVPFRTENLGGGSGSDNQVVNAFITKCDELKNFFCGRGKRLFIFMCTNRSSFIDPAVMRSGRIEGYVSIPYLNTALIKKVLLQFIARTPVCSGEDKKAWDDYVAGIQYTDTDCLSPADLQSAVKHMLLIRSDENQSFNDLQNAITKNLETVIEKNKKRNDYKPAAPSAQPTTVNYYHIEKAEFVLPPAFQMPVNLSRTKI